MPAYARDVIIHRETIERSAMDVECGSARYVESRINESAVSLAMYEYYSTYRNHKGTLRDMGISTNT